MMLQYFLRHIQFLYFHLYIFEALIKVEFWYFCLSSKRKKPLFQRLFRFEIVINYLRIGLISSQAELISFIMSDTTIKSSGELFPTA